MGGFVWFPVMPINSDIMSTRPRNIAEQSVIFDISDSWSVIPSDEPTVNKADTVSNITALGGSPGSSRSSAVV